MVWIITSNQDLIKKGRKALLALRSVYFAFNIGQLLIKSQEFSKRNKRLSTIWNFNKYIEVSNEIWFNLIIKAFKTYNLKGIIIKTVHSVKGGEFDVVFLPYQRSGSFPLNYRSNQFINKPPDEWLRYSENSTISSKEHHYEEERHILCCFDQSKKGNFFY